MFFYYRLSDTELALVKINLSLVLKLNRDVFYYLLVRNLILFELCNDYFITKSLISFKTKTVNGLIFDLENSLRHQNNIKDSISYSIKNISNELKDIENNPYDYACEIDKDLFYDYFNSDDYKLESKKLQEIKQERKNITVKIKNLKKELLLLQRKVGELRWILQKKI